MEKYIVVYKDALNSIDKKREKWDKESKIPIEKIENIAESCMCYNRVCCSKIEPVNDVVLRTHILQNSIWGGEELRELKAEVATKDDGINYVKIKIKNIRKYLMNVAHKVKEAAKIMKSVWSTITHAATIRNILSNEMGTVGIIEHWYPGESNYTPLNGLRFAEMLWNVVCSKGSEREKEEDYDDEWFIFEIEAVYKYTSDWE